MTNGPHSFSALIHSICSSEFTFACLNQSFTQTTSYLKIIDLTGDVNLKPQRIKVKSKTQFKTDPGDQYIPTCHVTWWCEVPTSTHIERTLTVTPPKHMQPKNMEFNYQWGVSSITTAPPSASAAAHTFNTLTTGTFGSFAGQRRGWPTASPSHPVPNAAAISASSAGGHADIEKHFELVSSLFGANREPSGRVGDRRVQFVLREHQAV